MNIMRIMRGSKTHMYVFYIRMHAVSQEIHDFISRFPGSEQFYPTLIVIPSKDTSSKKMLMKDIFFAILVLRGSVRIVSCLQGSIVKTKNMCLNNCGITLYL